MKIVINNCYGGFGLSVEAMIRAIEEGANGIEVCSEKEYNGNSDPNEKLNVRNGYASDWCGTIYKDGKVYNFKRYKNEYRSDPVLVRIVEEMGEKANGPFSRLKVVEIPNGIEWCISEYDGSEEVQEKHRSWS